MVDVDPNLRAILDWTGQALVYSTPVLAVLLWVMAFGQPTQRVSRGDRRPVPVTVVQGLILLAAAMGCLGIGLALLSLSVAQLVALGLGIILLAVLVGAYGVRLIRTRS